MLSYLHGHHGSIIHKFCESVSSIAIKMALTLCAVGFVLSSPRTALATEGTVTLEDGTQLVANIQWGRADKAVFVLVNGLVYQINRWDQLANQLVNQGHTVVRYAFSGQPENLRLLPQGQEPAFFQYGLDLNKMANELAGLLNHLGLNRKVHVVGLSYGATVATQFALLHPDRVEATILMSPLVIPLDYYDPNGQALRAWLNTVRFWENAPCQFFGVANPFLCLAEDYWYDSFYRHFYQNYLFERVSQIPVGIDEVVYKKAIFHLVRAVRDFDLRMLAPRMSNVHMILTSEEEPRLLRDQQMAWSLVADTEKRSLALFHGAQHALPDAAPVRTAQWLDIIASKHPEVMAGQSFDIPADH